MAYDTDEKFNRIIDTISKILELDKTKERGDFVNRYTRIFEQYKRNTVDPNYKIVLYNSNALQKNNYKGAYLYAIRKKNAGVLLIYSNLCGNEMEKHYYIAHEWGHIVNHVDNKDENLTMDSVEEKDAHISALTIFNRYSDCDKAYAISSDAFHCQMKQWCNERDMVTLDWIKHYAQMVVAH